MKVQSIKDSVNQPPTKANKVQFIEMPEQDEAIEPEVSETSPGKDSKTSPKDKSSPPALAPSISIDACEEPSPPLENDIKSGEAASGAGDGKTLLTKP